MTLQRARSLVNRFEEEPHVNPNTGTREHGSSRSEIRTGITLRLVQCLWTEEGSQLAEGTPELSGGSDHVLRFFSQCFGLA